MDCACAWAYNCTNLFGTLQRKASEAVIIDVDGKTQSGGFAQRRHGFLRDRGDRESIASVGFAARKLRSAHGGSRAARVRRDRGFLRSKRTIIDPLGFFGAKRRLGANRSAYRRSGIRGNRRAER